MLPTFLAYDLTTYFTDGFHLFEHLWTSVTNRFSNDDCFHFHIIGSFLCEKEICDIAACCLPWDQHGTEQLSINSAVYFPIYGQLYFPIYWQLYFPIYGSCIYQKLNSLHCAEQLSWHSPKFVLRCQIKSAPAQPLLAHVCVCVANNGNTLFKFSLNGHANVLYGSK